MTARLRIDIVSDIVCPWCLVGWERLKRALHEVEAEITADVHWLPFELNPDLPEAGVDRRTYMEQKFGPERAREIEANLAAVAAADGIAMRLDRIVRQPNTFAAHRLIHLAGPHGAATAAKEALLRAHFVDGRAVGDLATLLDIAAAVGLDPEAIRAGLAAPEAAEAVRALERRAQELGIRGVPFFILDGRLAVSGAQTPEVLVGAMHRALAMRDAA